MQTGGGVRSRRAPLPFRSSPESVVHFDLGRGGAMAPVAELVPRRAGGLAELEGEIFPCLLGAVAEPSRTARDARAALGSGARREQHRHAGPEGGPGGDPSAEEEKLV